jgi:UDP-3-O-[3-hydroxymyristoyl] N-acetylglucosamine deacetylase / 3-hydroxyacyl-[acyl-carrier-protein] dehydratase
MEKQKTIGRSVEYIGIALHTGNRAKIIFKPAPAHHGVVFVRTDLPEPVSIKADVAHVVSTQRGTNLGVGDVRVHTVEHVLAALMGFGIDNLIIEMDANEPPVGDGSALPFVKMLKDAGVVELDPIRDFHSFRDAAWISEGDGTLVNLPSLELRLSCTIDFNHPVLKSQYLSVAITPETFEKEIAPARTFCFYHEVEALQDRGLIKGGSLDNAVVIGDDAIFSKEDLRFPDEFVRHKMLDIMGDMFLLGRPFKSHIVAMKSGHELNIKLARKMSPSMPKKSEASVPPSSGLESYLDINRIKQILPHRYPFLLVDRILETDCEKRIVGLKNLTVNEDFFNGHFPSMPVMPGVLQLEAMAQTAGVLMMRRSENTGKMAFFMAMDDVKFRKTVVPGDQLILEIEVLKWKKKIGKVRGTAYVQGEVVSEANLMFAFME